MGKWSEQYIEKNSTPLTETTANSCQKPNQAGSDPLLSVIGSGFVPADKKNTFSKDKAKKSKVLKETTAKTDKSQFEVLNNFCRLVQHYGADHGVLLEESVILSELDSEGIADLQAASTTVMQSWAEALAIRLVQVRGIVPKGWDKVAHCQHCGPVWAEHDLPTLSCGWCWMRLAGKRLPQPDIEICRRCGASIQATHHELCESRDGTPTDLDDATVRRLIRQEHPAWRW